jgi:hypothetical protein
MPGREELTIKDLTFWTETEGAVGWTAMCKSMDTERAKDLNCSAEATYS